MKNYVIDASVLLTIIIGDKEKVAKQAKPIFKLMVQKKAVIYAPPLVIPEFANGLRFTLGIKQIDLTNNALSKFEALPLQLQALTIEEIKQALRLSYQHQTTYYDTSYHVLAMSVGGTFLTTDRKYYNKAKNIGSIECWG